MLSSRKYLQYCPSAENILMFGEYLAANHSSCREALEFTIEEIICDDEDAGMVIRQILPEYQTTLYQNA